MAKVKKKVALSLEERLEQALVSVDEQPYDVPENWCWVEIESLVEICLGLTHTPTYVDAGVPFLSVKDITGGYIDFTNTKFITEEEYNSLPYGAKPQKGDILFARVGTIGAPQIVETDKKFGTFVSLGFFRPKSESINRKYIAYWINSIIFEKQVSENVKGSTLKNLNTGWLRHFQIPLPPECEQQRIVEQIESLFTKLDEAKEKVSEVITSSQIRKDALLYKAFAGSLTSKWRRENNIQLMQEYFLFDECIQKMQNGLAKRSGTTGKEFAVIRLANLSVDGFVTDDLRKILLDENEQENYRLYADDVVMIRVNGSKDNVARQICVESDTEWAFCDHIIRIKYDNAKVLPRFMVYFSKSQYYRNYIADNMVSSAGQNTISRKGMSNLLVPKFVLEEQKEIIKILDMLWKTEDEVQIKAEQAVEQIDLMKKAILAKAFCGELGTNNSDEESAAELLKKIVMGE